jgi:hypothetical protein
VSLAAIFGFHYRHPVANSEDVLPLLLLVGVLAFRAHSYDMVFLIPAFIWALG